MWEEFWTNSFLEKRVSLVINSWGLNFRKVNFNKLSSNAHTIHQIKQRKLALTSFEDKRQLLNCSIHTKPYGDTTVTDFRCLICNK